MGAGERLLANFFPNDLISFPMSIPVTVISDS